jgi:hypothetical protein
MNLILSESDPLLNEIPRPGFYFQKDFHQVQPVHSKEKHLESHAQGDQGSQGQPTRLEFRLACEMKDSYCCEVCENDKDNQCAKVEGELQANCGKGKNAVRGKAEGLPEGVTAVACKPGGAIKNEFHLVKSNVGNLATEKLEMLTHRVEGVDTLPVEQAEVSTSRNQLDFCDPIKEPVKPLGEGLFRKACGCWIFSDRVDHVSSLLPKFEHFRENGRWMLEVSVQGNDNIPGGMLETATKCVLMASVPGEGKATDFRMGFRQFPDNFESAIFAAVINKHDLVSCATDGLHDPLYFGNEFPDAGFFVIEGHH